MRFPKEKKKGDVIVSKDGKRKFLFNGFAWDKVPIETSVVSNTVKMADNIYSEMPSGIIDDVNFKYTLSQTPIKETLQIYLNGVIQKLDADYTVVDNQLYFVEPPYENSTITCFYLYETHKKIYAETPSGIFNGINNVFVLLNMPKPGTEMIFLNGVLQKEGNNYDYVLSEKNIFFNESPLNGSSISCNYET